MFVDLSKSGDLQIKTDFINKLTYENNSFEIKDNANYEKIGGDLSGEYL